jgi:hypothetical protein
MGKKTLPYEEPEPATDTYQDPRGQYPLSTLPVSTGIVVVVAAVDFRPSLIKGITSQYEDQDGKGEIYNKAECDRKLEEERKG